MKLIYVTVGSASLLLGFVGIFVPLLPTTAFVLLSAYCFSRSSKRLNHWLLEKSIFGPSIKHWQQHRAMSAAVKKRAMILVVLSFTVTIYLIENTLLRLFLLVFGLGLLYFLARIPSLKAEQAR